MPDSEKSVYKITTKLVLSIVCMVLLLFSVPSALNMYAVGQNSTDQASDDTDSSDNSSEENSDNSSQSEDESSKGSSSSGSAQQDSDNDGGTTSANATSSQDQNQNANSTSSVEETPSQVSDMTGYQQLVTISGEPFVLSEKSITRSFSYPILQFNGEVASELDIEITWNTDGTTDISDNRGYRYTMTIPESQGIFSLWHNGTHVDQRVVGPELQYDVYWTAAEGEAGNISQGITITVTWVYRSCDCGPWKLVDWKIISRTLDIPLGYDRTYASL